MPAPTIGTPPAIIGARPLVHPGYIVANWYNPFLLALMTTSAFGAANFILFMPFTLEQTVTISDLGARVTTAAAGGSFQMAIYPRDPATNKPNGAALTSTGSLSTAAVASVSTTLGASVTLTAGTYWLAFNSDTNGAAAVMQAISASGVFQAALIGSPTLGNVLAGASTPLAYRIAQTFGTWPTISAASVTEGNYAMPLGALKISAVGA